ncbi:hypothetical protein VPH35_097260 [Triticum aestivum]|uniref:Uncharacterized protein n=1 Tax=Aegilops tauschii TaxID=37682 RepID=M8C8Q9_AEGTA
MGCSGQRTRLIICFVHGDVTEQKEEGRSRCQSGRRLSGWEMEAADLTQLLRPATLSSPAKQEEADAIKIMSKAMLIPVLSEMDLLDARFVALAPKLQALIEIRIEGLLK